VTITSLSGLENIGFQDTYYLNGWSDYSVATDPSAPPTGFGFKNAIVASAVITLAVQGENQPSECIKDSIASTGHLDTDAR
jgi:hypothetical protein